MRTLASNEKHLLLLLCGALLIAVNLVGLRSFLKAKEGLRKAMIAATSDVTVSYTHLTLPTIYSV